MKKKIIAILLAGILLLPLLGCSAPPSGANDYNVECNRYKTLQVSDRLEINTYNDYQIDDYELVENDDGTYSVTVLITYNPYRK